MSKRDTTEPQSSEVPHDVVEQPERPAEPLVESDSVWTRVAEVDRTLTRCEATAARIEASR